MIQRQSLKDEVLKRLKMLVLSGEYPPGKRIVIDSVAKELGVSVTPVREALHHLVAQGLLELQTHRGFIVKGLSTKELEDILEVRLSLEKLAVRLFIERGVDEYMLKLKRLIDEMKVLVDAGDVERMGEINSAYHMAIIDGSGNIELKKIMKLLGEKLYRIRMLSISSKGRLEESFEEHLGIFDAIEKKDSSLAEKAVERHIRSIRNTILKKVSKEVV